MVSSAVFITTTITVCVALVSCMGIIAATLNVRIGGIETTLNARIDGLETHIASGFDRIEARLDEAST